MIEIQKCPKCRTRYEISWDDTEEIYSASVEDSDLDDIADECREAIFCPFCGTNRDLCSDEELDDAYDWS